MKVPAVTIIPWLRENLGREALAPLTSQDTTALRAAVSIIDLIAYQNHPRDLQQSFLACVLRMQEHTRHLAYHAIAHVLDWQERQRIWSACGLTPPATRCKHEPKIP